MATASASEAISLPTGGGALAGIGETFAADPQTGAASLRIPIAVPQGRGGFQPALALTYSSHAGQSAFGLGWDLDVPSLGRSTNRGVPRYDDAADTFLLTGGEELV